MFLVSKFQKYKDHYKGFLQHYKHYDEMYKWASLKNFQENWNMDADNFLAMYDSSFHNDHNDNFQRK